MSIQDNTNTQQSNWMVIVLAIVSLAVIALGAAWAMSAPPFEKRSTVTAPGVEVQTRDDDVKIDAPYTSIQKDDSGTRIKAPGVDIELPPKPNQ